MIVKRLAYKIKKSILPICVILWFILTLYTLVMLFYPYRLAEVTEPILVGNKIVKRGDTLELTITYNKKRDIPTRTIKTISCDDGNLVTMTPTPSETNLPQGKHTIITTSTIIPQKISTNTYCYLVFGVTYKPNVLREVTNSYKTEKFFVTE
jgi:hypothetical protein